MGVLSIVLMFVFALPTFKGATKSDMDKAVVGYIGKKKVTHDDQTRSNNELQFMRETGLFRHPAYQFLVQRVKDESDLWLYWMLIKEEAKKYASPIATQEDINEAAGIDIGSHSPHDVELVLGNLRCVAEYADFLARLPRPSSEVELQADRVLRKVRVWYLTLDATRDWEQVADPTDAQIQAQFNNYKSIVRTSIPAADEPPRIPPDKAGHHFPFGYKYPDEVEVEYVVFDRAAIEKLVTAKDDAAQKQRDLTEAYDKVFSVDPAYKGKKWEDVKDELIKAQVAKRVDRRMKLMTDAFMERASKVEDAGGTVNYADLIKEISKTSEFLGYEPQMKKLPLMGAEDLAKVEGIGSAWYHSEARNRDFSFSKLAVSLPELVKFEANDPIGLLKPKVGLEGQLLVDTPKNNYVYRVTKAVPTHEPASLDENGIRKLVIEDCKKLETYKRNVDRMKTLARTAGTTDIEELGNKEKLPMSKPPQFTQLNALQYNSLTSPETLAAYDPKLINDELRNQGLDPLKEVLSIPNMSSTAFSLSNSAAPAGGKRAGSLEREDALRCYVLQIQEVVPATGEEFARARPDLLRQPTEGAIKFVQDYLSQDSLEKRMKWKKL